MAEKAADNIHHAAEKQGLNSRYLVAGGAAIIVIAVAVVLMLSTPSHGAVRNSIPANCPCLSEQQMEILLNESQASIAGSTFNASYASPADMGASLHNATNATEFGILRNLTQGWSEMYAGATGNEGVVSTVFQSASPAMVYKAEVKNAALSNVSVYNGTVNGLVYSYAVAGRTNATMIIMTGYKDDYVVMLTLISGNRGIYSPESIANMVSSTV